MSLKDLFSVRKTGYKALDEFRLQRSRIEIYNGSEGELLFDEILDQYRISFTATIQFNSSIGSFPAARSAAEQHLIANIYRDVRDVLHDLKGAILDGNSEAAWAACDAIDKITKGEK